MNCVKCSARLCIMARVAARPGPVDLKNGNVCKAWERFKQKFEIFLIATGQATATSKVRWALLMGEAGDDAYDVYTSFKDKLVTKTRDADGNEVVTDQSESYEAVIAEFNSFAAEKRSLTACREQFNSRNQRAQEPFTTWLTDLRNLIRPCEYGNIEESMLKDRLVWGTRDKRLRESLRAKPAYTLQEVIDACKAVENAHKDSPAEELAVDAVGLGKAPGQNRHHGTARGSYRHGRGLNRGKKRPFADEPRGQQPVQGSRGRQAFPAKASTYLCKKCDRVHGPRNCPAHAQQCKACGGWNHWKIVCKKRGNSSSRPTNSRAVNSTEMLSGNDGETKNIILESWTAEVIQELDTIDVQTAEDDDMLGAGPAKRARREYTEVLKIAGKHFIKFKLDPGSEANILPLTVFNQISHNNGYKLHPSKVIIKAFGKTYSKVEGEIKFLIEAKHGDSMTSEFLVSKHEDRPILGIEACEELNRVKRVIYGEASVYDCTVQRNILPESKEEFISQFIEVFTGLGKFKQPVKILIDPKVPCGMSPPRRYGVSITDRLKEHLKILKKDGIVTKVTTEIPKFISNLVIREKPNGNLRVCLDPEILNKAIIRQQYTIPSFEEIACKMQGKRIFTVLDLKDGFWHATLDPESSLLCSFSTPYGIYKFNKMPFGIKCAPEIFQFLNDQVFRDTGAIIYFDDLLIAGKDYAEHDLILSKVINKAIEEYIRFNRGKIQYRKLQVKFLGLLWSLNQIKIDPNRTAAIMALKEPTTKKKLQQIMGVFNHLRKFIPQMGTVAAPLYALLPKSVQFLWLPEHSEAFNELKVSICRAPALTPFDKTKPIVVQADASQSGMGALLLQDKRPVSSASRKLTDSEKNYAQIEEEMLALSYAAEKFENFIYGMPKVVFQTDHQPLVSIFKKPLHKITNNRLKKLRLKLLKYSPTVEYLPGKFMFLTDLLSRDYLDEPVEDDPEMIEVVHEVTTHLQVSPQIKDDLVKGTAEDTGLQAVMRYYQNGWPSNRKNIIPSAQQYWKLKNDLFVEEGLVILESKVVVPETMRSKVLKQLHLAHMGIEKTKNRARQIVYWPGINNDIATMIAECRVCERHSAANCHEPLIPQEIPHLRFQKVSCDILTHNQKPYLIVEDNLSHWLEIIPLPDKTSNAVINALRPIFSTHGIPEEIFGDNNPLNSYTCKEFAKSLGIKITTSSPGYPRSNGLAEKGVGIARNILDKCQDDGKHHSDALREYNNTPLSDLKVSSAQILMSRMCRTVVPTTKINLEPKIVDVRPMLKKLQNKVKERHDKHARRKSVYFEPGESIVFRRNGKWHKGTVIRKHDSPRSYIIRQLNGRELRRNTFHLRKSKTKPDRHDNVVEHYDLDGFLNCSQAQEETPAPQEEVIREENPLPEGNNHEGHIHHHHAGERRTRSGRVTRTPSRFRQ